MAWRAYNPNPYGSRVGDCAVRACCEATGHSWERTHAALCLESFCMGDMPSANHVWGTYLRRHDYKRRMIPEDCAEGYTVADFCRDHPKGMYVLALGGHVVAVQDGDWFDTWDSGGEIPAYYWVKEGE